MKTKNLIALAVVAVSGLTFFLSSCDKDTETVTEYKEKITGCMNASAINYNASATEDDGTCILPEQLNDTTRTIYGADAHTANTALVPWHDHTHSNLSWATDYKDLGYSVLTGRFVEFDLVEPMIFNEKTPSLTQFKAWVQISSNFTGESGRDEMPNGCMPKDLGVRWDSTTSTVVEASDLAYLETTPGACEFYYAAKRGFTTSYRVPAKLKFREQAAGGALFESDVTVYFNYNGLDYESGRSGFIGYFDFQPKADHGVKASASCGEDVRVSFNIQVRFK